MIRPATTDDIPAIVAMTGELARATAMPIGVDAGATAAFLRALIPHRDGFARVVEIDGRPEGMLIASLGHASVSRDLIAIEHGWFCRPAAAGWGLKLLASYEAWARAQGCALARMSIAPGSPLGPMLCKRRGYRFAETALVKAL